MAVLLNPVTEAELRQFMRLKLAKESVGQGGRMYEELGVEGGGARVDLAVISDRLDAYELKSDLDNLGRLHNQIHAFNRVFDRITLVSGPEHAAAIVAAVPSWWGLIQISRETDGGMTSHTIREAKPNPLQQPESLAALLWRAEAVAALEAGSGKRMPLKASRMQLYQQLAQLLPLESLRDIVAATLKNRDYSMLAVNTR